MDSERNCKKKKKLLVHQEMLVFEGKREREKKDGER